MKLQKYKITDLQKEKIANSSNSCEKGSLLSGELVYNGFKCSSKKRLHLEEKHLGNGSTEATLLLYKTKTL